MNRRNFLFLRTTPTGRTLELSCRSLYLRYLTSEALARTGADISAIDNGAWTADGSAAFTHSSPEIFKYLENDLRGVDVLHVLDCEWLEQAGLKEKLEPVLASFRARGGRVEYPNGA